MSSLFAILVDSIASAPYGPALSSTQMLPDT
jgi:hypothetical protein